MSPHLRQAAPGTAVLRLLTPPAADWGEQLLRSRCRRERRAAETAGGAFTATGSAFITGAGGVYGDGVWVSAAVVVG